MFRRTPAAPHPHADLLEDGDADTVVIDRIGDTAQMPAVPIEPEPVTDVMDSITTAPTTIIQSAVEVTRADPIRPAPVPQRPRPSQSVPRRPTASQKRPRVSHSAPRRLRPSQALSRSPGTVHGWVATLRDVRHDPMTMIYLLLIALAAVIACWGTTVIFKPEWVPQSINPRPVPSSSAPSDDPGTPAHRRVLVPHPRKPAEASRKAEPHPAKAPASPGAQRPTVKLSRGTPVTPSRKPPVTPSTPASGTPSKEPDPTTQPPTKEPTPSDPPTSQTPDPTPTETATERPPEEPSVTPTETESASASPTRTQSETPSGEPTRSAPETPEGPSPEVS